MDIEGRIPDASGDTGDVLKRERTGHQTIFVYLESQMYI